MHVPHGYTAVMLYLTAISVQTRNSIFCQLYLKTTSTQNVRKCTRLFSEESHQGIF